MKLRTRLRRRFRRFNQRVASLDVRKLFAIALICVALDTGTAFLHFKLSPETFAQYEQNDLFKWGLVSGHAEGYLVAESIKVMAAVTVFALASWFTIFRLAMLVFPMVTLFAVSTNLIAIVTSPTIALQFGAIAIIAVVFNINRERWFTK